MSSSTWKVLDLKNKWDVLNTSLNAIGDHLAVNAAEIPTINQFSADTEFRTLVNALGTMRNEIADLSREISSQTEYLSIDFKYFYDLSKDYESEIEVFKKGREQAFQLYDNLAAQHQDLLREFETVKADLKIVSETISTASEDKRVADEALSASEASNTMLSEELTALRISMATLQKRIEILEEENARLSSVKSHEDQDRNELIDQLAKEIKSRNDALVLAEAARNELSRVLGEAEKDRMSRDEAERDREDATASVEGLQDTIEQMQQQVEEQEKINKHEMVMRHKVEENLIEVEDTLKLTSEELQSTAQLLVEANKQLEHLGDLETKWREEKDMLTSQIGLLAQQMAGGKLENQKLTKTLEQVQQEAEAARQGSEDSVEKRKQLERIVNQLIQDKAELEAAVSRVETEKAKIIEDSKDIVTLRAKLDESVSQCQRVTELFEEEKKLKSQVDNALKQAEKRIADHDAEKAKIGESLSVASKERDELKTSLEGVQKVLQGERLARAEAARQNAALESEFAGLQSKFQQEETMKAQALSSLEAESRSKQEAIKQLEEARKSDSKAQAAAEKFKADTDSLKDKLKEEERAKKDLSKQLEDMRKELGKSQTETEKATRAKEEAVRKSEAESAALKEAEKGWNSEKAEHEKTYKAYYDEKAKREQFEAENGTLKSLAAEAEKAAESERVEHAKTFKAYEAERAAHAKVEAAVVELKSAVAGAKSTEQSMLADLQGAEKRIKRLEAQLADVSDAKDATGKEVAQLPGLRKQLDQAERVKSDLEAKLAAERQKRAESEEKLTAIREEDEKMRIRTNNVAMENEKLVKRVARLEGELDAERGAKNELIAALESHSSGRRTNSKPSVSGEELS